MAKLVVLGTLVGIAQHAVSLCRLLKFLFGLLVARILVGVILYGHLSISLLYFVCTGVFCNAKHLVVISFLCHDP